VDLSVNKKLAQSNNFAGGQSMPLCRASLTGSVLYVIRELLW
jgi:hypothetical protein